jgi:hypothetical protein
MRLPNAESAIIEDVKITQYLLSSTHHRGLAKAAFFESFGFRLDAWHLFASALFDHAQAYEVSRTASTLFGEIFEVNGRLVSPDGRNPWVLVVWFYPSGESLPRLVTAVPSKGPRR